MNKLLVVYPRIGLFLQRSDRLWEVTSICVFKPSSILALDCLGCRGAGIAPARALSTWDPKKEKEEKEEKEEEEEKEKEEEEKEEEEEEKEEEEEEEEGEEGEEKEKEEEERQYIQDNEYLLNL
ncbi:unnamed protein product [Boreogadus saida]